MIDCGLYWRVTSVVVAGQQNAREKTRRGGQNGCPRPERGYCHDLQANGSLKDHRCIVGDQVDAGHLLWRAKTASVRRLVNEGGWLTHKLATHSQ